MTLLIRKLAEYLNLFKDFNTEYKACNTKAFILHHENKTYTIRVEEIDNKEKLNDYELLDKYCK